jgi:hypothetical protein
MTDNPNRIDVHITLEGTGVIEGTGLVRSFMEMTRMPQAVAEQKVKASLCEADLLSMEKSMEPVIERCAQCGETPVQDESGRPDVQASHKDDCSRQNLPCVECGQIMSLKSDGSIHETWAHSPLCPFFRGIDISQKCAECGFNLVVDGEEELNQSASHDLSCSHRAET